MALTPLEASVWRGTKHNSFLEYNHTGLYTYELKWITMTNKESSSINTAPCMDSKTIRADVHTRVLRGLAGMQTLRKQWEGLHVYCNLWSRFEWYYAYATNLAIDSDAIFFIQVLVGEETVAIIPAEISQQEFELFGSLKVLRIASHSHVGLTDFPLNPLIDPSDVAKQMFKAFQKLPIPWDVIRWSRIMHSSNAFLIARKVSDYHIYIRQAQPCNTIDTSNSFEKLFDGLSSKTRRNLKAARKHFAEPIDWHIELNKDGEDYARYYEEFLRIESSGWKGQSGAGSAISLNSGTHGFYASLLEQRNHDFLSEINLLIFESQAIAGLFGISVKGSKHLLKIGYDECYSKMSPGSVLLEETLRAACSTITTNWVDLVSNMPWLAKWRPRKEETFDVIIFRRWFPGVLFGRYLQARKVAKFIVMWGKKVWLGKINLKICKE